MGTILMGEQIDPTTVQWREMFAKLTGVEFQHIRETLDGIRGLLEKQNGRLAGLESTVSKKADEERVRKVELAVEGIKTWVALIGGVTGLIGIAAALLQAMR